MQLVQQRAPQGFGTIEDVLSAEELEGTAAAYKQIAGFDKDALNSRGSIITSPEITSPAGAGESLPRALDPGVETRQRRG